MGPFSLTGQPNAMGGREVGGLANQLAAHMEIDNPDHRDKVGRFWQAPRMAARAGLKAVDLFQAIEAGRVRAAWIIATNPLVSLPDSNRMREALASCPLVVVSDCVARNDTLTYADIALPATAWGEKDGTVTNSERRISRQRRFLDAPGEARDDWRIVCDVAKAMGFTGFDYQNAAAIFREHAALSGFENDGERAFDISNFSHISDAAYETLAPTQWAGSRLFADGAFFTPDRRARLVAITPRPPQGATSRAFPLTLNTGRVRDHWHTMTRTGRSARLSAHSFEPYLEIHPEDARRCGVVADGLARVESAHGAMVARVRVVSEQRRGCVFAPMHWSDAFAARARVNALVAAYVDPISGQPESKQTPVRVEPFAVAWRGFAMARERIAAPDAEYWVAGRGRDHWRLELAGTKTPADWEAWARSLVGAGGEWSAYRDPGAGVYRFASVVEGGLAACVFVARDAALPAREWLGGLFAAELSAANRLSLLAGGPRDAGADIGPIVCSCFGVGRHQIEAAIAAGAASVDAIGARLKAGGNCGSCKSELARLVETRAPRMA